MKKNLTNIQMAKVLALELSIASVIFGMLVSPFSARGEPIDENWVDGSFKSLLVPTADPVYHTNMSLYLTSYPIGLIGQVAVPIGSHATTILYGGAGVVLGDFEGLGGVVSPSLRVHMMRPDGEQWGLAVQAQWIGGGLVSKGTESGSTVSAIQIMASSPVKHTRTNFGVALHTMPGLEFNEKRYDFGNPQTTPFISGEYKIKKTTLFSEVIWIAINADEGRDSQLIGIVGCNFSFGRVDFKVGSGIFIHAFGSDDPDTIPMPPVFSLSFPI
jgi:hypothetical protein